MNIANARQWARAQLDDANDADYLLCGVLNKNRSYLYAFGDKALSDSQQNTFEAAIERRKNGEPVAYILGEKEFWSLPFNVSTDTLIPRPETEILVEQVLARITDRQAAICDLGTGTGAIALAIASERPDWQLTGVDRIPAAIALAEHNAERLGIKNAAFHCSNWFANLPKCKFNVIVTNPPYVETNSPYLNEGDVRFEPV